MLFLYEILSGIPPGRNPRQGTLKPRYAMMVLRYCDERVKMGRHFTVRYVVLAYVLLTETCVFFFFLFQGLSMKWHCELYWPAVWNMFGMLFNEFPWRGMLLSNLTGPSWMWKRNKSNGSLEYSESKVSYWHQTSIPDITINVAIIQ